MKTITPRRLRHALLAGLVISVAASVGTGPAYAATATVAFNPNPPVPMAALQITVTGQGCSPSTPITIHAERANVFGDVGDARPSFDVSTVADTTGAWNGVVDVPVAYPGRWWVQPGCASQGESFEIPVPTGFSLAVSPLVVTMDVPTSFVISAAGCTSSSALWYVGYSSFWGVASGTVPVAGDGTWSASPTVVVPTGSTQVKGGRTFVGAQCLFPDGVNVDYPAVSVAVVAAPSSTVSTSTSTSQPAVSVQPAFTG